MIIDMSYTFNRVSMLFLLSTTYKNWIGFEGTYTGKPFPVQIFLEQRKQSIDAGSTILLLIIPIHDTSCIDISDNIYIYIHSILIYIYIYM